MIIAERRRRQSDHYYWLTALIAARGMQATTSRVVAALIFGFGVIPVTLIGTFVGPTGFRDRLLAVVITV